MTEGRPTFGKPLILDVEHLGTMCGEDPVLERELLQTYLITAESRLSLLSDAIGAGDPVAMLSAARTLKLSSRCIGADALADACLELESLGVRGLTAGAVTAFAITRRQHRRLRVVIAARLTRRAP
ncbi:MAG: Hpt domain-containing protein [Candidatus Eisenbacteria bacterium]